VTRPPAGAPPRLGLALAALALGGFAIGTTEFVAMGLLPEIARGVGIAIPTGGHLISAYALGVVVGAPVLAAVGARFPRRALLVGLMAFYAAANLLSAVAPSYEALLGTRFLAGLPHGAYFGVASLVAADMAGAERRARAVARVMLGLTVANVAGVPFATWLGQTFGWRSAFAAGAALAVLCAVSVARVVRWTPADPRATVRRELGALRRPQVWLAFAIGAVGGGGMFAVYSYISPILTDRAGLAVSLVPVALAVWGLGMVVGGLAGGRLIDWRPVPTMLGAFVGMIVLFAAFTVTSGHPVAAIATVFFLGFSIVLPAGLQLRLMDVAGDAQTLAAALNHSAFNAANALGAWLGGTVLAAGLGLTAPMWVAVALSAAGLVIFVSALGLERRASAPGRRPIAVRGRPVDVSPGS
jgi:DHA1 family inner membrane transport protein